MICLVVRTQVILRIHQIKKKREKIADNENIIKLLQNPCCLHNCLSNWTFNELKAYLSQKAYLQNKPSIQ